MSERKTYAVIGLGIFGSEAAAALVKEGADVIALDNDMEHVQAMADYIPNVVQADGADIEQLKAAGIGDADTAIVAMGSHLEASIMTILNLKQLGIPYIIAKANNDRYMEVLKKIGADDVIQPEKESGRRTAARLLSRNIVDLFDIGDDYVLAEIHAPEMWQNKSLKELNLRETYDLSILAVKNESTDKLRMIIKPSYIIKESDTLLIAAKNEIIAKLNLE